MNIFCFGLSYTALNLYEYIVNVRKSDSITSDFSFSGTHRTEYKSENIKNYIYDDLISIPENSTHILISIPPNEHGDIAFARFKNHFFKLKHLKWVGYLSTTGVYGDHGGNWVDEESVLYPSNQQSLNRVIAEKQWLKLFQEQNIPVHIFRLSGIYGKNRNIFLRIFSNKAEYIYKPNHFFSRIHITDLVHAIYLSMVNVTPGEIFNVADDLPSASHEVMEYAYYLLKIKPPELTLYENATLSQMARNFYQNNKRVKNDKIKKHLDLTLKYQSYKEGYMRLLNLYCIDKP